MSGTFVECRLELIDETSVRYSDDWNRTPVTEKVDRPDLAKATVAWLSGLVETDEEWVSGEGLKILGRHLYESLFVERIDATFRATFAGFEQESGVRGLRLVISFGSAAENLARLPWEFLYLAAADGGRGTFLAGERHSLVLTRSVAGQQRPARPGAEPTTVLLATNTPAGSDVGTTAKLVDLLKGERAKRALPTTSLPNPTYTELKAAVEQQRPHVLHIIGHGAPGRLFMRRDPEEVENDAAKRLLAMSEKRQLEPVREVVPIDADMVGALFETHKPRVVFLQTCHGAASTDNALDAAAVDIVRAGVPAVVAMQYDIHADRADLFASTFYRALLGGRTIGEAVADGRRKLATGESARWDRRDFGIPVVYVHEDMEVVGRDGPAPHVEEEKAAAQTCPRCRVSVRHRACAVCGLLLFCPCGWKPEPRACECREELEHPVDGRFCGECTHPFRVDAGAPDPEAPGLRPVPPARRHDGFAGAG